MFGETKRADGSADPQAGDLNVESIENLGDSWGEFNLEKYAALAPSCWSPTCTTRTPSGTCRTRARQDPRARAQRGITTARVPMTKPIERYAALAESLGADLSAKKVTDAKARFDAAAEAVRQAVKANPGIKVMACSGSPDLFYVSNPKVSTDLMYFDELGVDIIVPNKLESATTSRR